MIRRVRRSATSIPKRAGTHVPLEIRVPGEPETFYNQTFEDVGLTNPRCAFAPSNLGWAARQALDDGSSQFFLFLYEAELTPVSTWWMAATAFGYVVDG